MRYFSKKSWVYLSIVLLGAVSCSSTPKKTVSTEEHARLLVNIANAQFQEGDPTGALQVLEQAEAENPKIPDLYHTRALCYFAKKDYPQAIASVKKALALRPDYPDAQTTLGKFYLDTGRYADAKAILAAPAKNALYRDSFKAWTNLGIISYREGEIVEAEKQFTHAIDQAPAQACIAYYYRGHIGLKKGQLQQAIRDYDQATKRICGGFSDAHLALGIAYESAKQYEKARKKYLETSQKFAGTEVADRAMNNLKRIP